jgi:hypothetical protein
MERRSPEPRRSRTERSTGAASSQRALPPTGLELVDRLSDRRNVTVDDYVRGASEYVRRQRSLTAGQKKAAQIRLSNALANALLAELHAAMPGMTEHALAGEIWVAGALRSAKVDVVEFHPQDGLRLAVEIKPVNLAVGRAIWNRFGDIRVTAVNLHLKFPFAVVGGLLAIPTSEEVTRRGELAMRDTRHLIRRAVDRFERAGGRRSEAEAAHLLEGVCVLAYDIESATIEPALPPAGKGLRWSEFIQAMASAYEARFGTDTGEPEALAGDTDDEQL